jgi:hypothetical protein
MYIIGSFYLNSGVIIKEKSELNQNEIEGLSDGDIGCKVKEAIKAIKSEYLTPCFQKNLNAYLEFGDTSFRLSDVSAVKFEIER